ncbi:glycosyltransferase family 1 protein [Microcoleus sp. LEGE 07076]|uniref:glycosyltransferase family 4 protein n=1 Tax=Microcoleus sp. LEGE 07076 TaxID=915322 RepID=UPI001880EC0F|nr:glycosyltransferase family 1 protein [Microcoleus sp. LEGE 07076]MBE9186663.1 glycosyltransferase family 1 protein [Microcoleus sp. LEGE 07076]
MISLTKKRIALISVHGDPAVEIGKEEAGGQNVYVRQVGEALAKQGWQVDMFTRSSDRQQARIVQHSRNCRTIRLVAGPQEFIPRDEVYGYLPIFVCEFQKFQLESGFQYPLVHTNYWLSAWVGMELKKSQPCQQVHTYHSLAAVKYKSVSTIPMIAKTRLQVEKTLLETADRVVATSPQEREHMRCLVSSKGKIDIIPCGTDIKQFGSIGRSAARRQLGIAPETKVVLYVGRFDRRKGIETLVRAVSLSALPKADLKLIIGGGWREGESDGKERDRIGSIVEELGLSDITSFPGSLSRDILPAYYAAADVCVVPSHYEPFGLVAIESMACRTPVVASDVGGLKYTVVPRETGLLASPKNEVVFAGAIDRLLIDSVWRQQLGQAGRQRVQSYFSWDGVASQLNQLYTQLLEQSAVELDPVSA